MFLGRHEHTLDSKGRLSIPAGFRTQLQNLGEGTPVLTLGKNHLALYPHGEFVKLAADIESVAAIDPKVQEFQRAVLFGAEYCPIDKQGRILVPAGHRVHARLERDVVVAGKSNHVEIWNPELLEAELARTWENFDELAVAVANRSRGSSKED